MLTPDAIESLAPDAPSIKAGRGLARRAKWPALGVCGDALWGECQGSGSKPYQTRIDMKGPAFKCSCPSHKFPCKHALGLLFLRAQSPGEFAEAHPPAWVSEWLESRREKQQAKTEKALEKAKKDADPQAQEKRVAARQSKVAAGIDELELWLGDLVRRGLSSVRAESYDYFDRMAARMIDAQAAGLANMVREIASAMSSGAGWESRALDKIGALFLLIRAARCEDQLPEPLRQDLRSLIGWSVPKDTVLAESPVRDEWYVWAVESGEQDRVRYERTWLQGKTTRRHALLLSFAAGTATHEFSVAAGRTISASLHFYPSAAPLRALIGIEGASSVEDSQPPAGIDGVDALLQVAAELFAIDPFLAAIPFALAEAQLVHRDEAFFLRDAQGKTLPIEATGEDLWRFFAISGGAPSIAFGLWTGSVLQLRTILAPAEAGATR
ncbi:MAG: SWIM zinc finger family protein [Sumerlaeia bacterium]